MHRRIPRLISVATAAVALFVAQGAATAAAKPTIGPKMIMDGAVTHKKIRDGHVKSAEVRNGAIKMVDLSAALQAKLVAPLELLDGAVTTAKLADNAVTSPKVAPDSLLAEDLGQDSVGSSEVAANSIQSGDIATSAINGAELAPNSVQGDEIENGSLDAVDVGVSTGSALADMPSVAAGSCASVLIDLAPGAGNVNNNPAVVTPSDGFNGNISFHAEAEGDQLRLRACNPTGAAINPDGAGTNYNYIVFG
jgi:hypothetical protein